VLVLLVTWLPLVFRRIALSVAIVCVAIGYVSARQGDVGAVLVQLDALDVPELITESVLLVALVGAGLKIDRAVGVRAWQSTWRLLVLGMPAAIGVMATLFVGLGGYEWAVALLLASVLAPTDPVLASQVAVGPPGSGDEGEVRFVLTSESGLNDGLAYPFVALALALAGGEMVDWEWLSLYFVGKTLLSIALGWGFGRAFGWLVFHPRYANISSAGDGLTAVSASFIAYAVAQLAGAYGFVAVFVAALALRATCRDSPFHNAMSDFSDQIERVLLMIVLIGFGCALAAGLLDALTWPDALAGLALLFVVRPFVVWCALVGAPPSRIARAAIAFFGIRGIGTIYYAIWAFNQHEFGDRDRMWALIAFVVLVSIVVHGIAATPVMHSLDERRQSARKEDARRKIETRPPRA
jgi:NhaP-type Na+/H+ or K+/H+ antiporter